MTNIAKPAPTFITDDEIATIAARIDDATPLPYDGATAEDTARAWRHNGGIAGRTLRLVRDGIPHRLLAALRAERDRAAAWKRLYVARDAYPRNSAQVSAARDALVALGEDVPQ